jgi:hypothetical protein
MIDIIKLDNIFLEKINIIWPEWNQNIPARILAKFMERAKIMSKIKFVPVCFIF